MQIQVTNVSMVYKVQYPHSHLTYCVIGILYGGSIPLKRDIKKAERHMYVKHLYYNTFNKKIRYILAKLP